MERMEVDSNQSNKNNLDLPWYINFSPCLIYIYALLCVGLKSTGLKV